MELSFHDLIGMMKEKHEEEVSTLRMEIASLQNVIIHLQSKLAEQKRKTPVQTLSIQKKHRRKSLLRSIQPNPIPHSNPNPLHPNPDEMKGLERTKEIMNFSFDLPQDKLHADHSYWDIRSNQANIATQPIHRS